MTTQVRTLSALTRRNPKEHHMALQTPGARIRVTLEGIVRTTAPGEVTFVDGTVIHCNSPAVNLDVIEPGFQPGDVVHDGTMPLLRVSPDGAAPYWMGTDGRPVHDDATDPTQLRLIARTAETIATEEQG